MCVCIIYIFKYIYVIYFLSLHSWKLEQNRGVLSSVADSLSSSSTSSDSSLLLFYLKRARWRLMLLYAVTHNTLCSYQAAWSVPPHRGSGCSSEELYMQTWQFLQLTSSCLNWYLSFTYCNINTTENYCLHVSMRRYKDHWDCWVKLSLV